MVLVSLLQSAQDGYGRELVRLVDHNGLETPLERLVLLEVFLVFVQCCRSYGSQLSSCQSRLEDICRVHRAFRGSRTDQCVYLVDEQDYLAI